MTLILSCVTEDRIYQISDRRLTSPVPPYEPVDEDTNKVVIANGRVCFGYTGPSQIGDRRTDDWLADVIATVHEDDMAAVSAAITKAATEAFATRGIRAQMAFQGVGWLRLRNENWLSPAALTIHNGIDPSTGKWLPYVLPEFRLNTNFPSKLPGGMQIYSVGVDIHRSEGSAGFRLMRKVVRHRHATPRVVGDALVRLMWGLAARHKTIGRNLMLFSVSRAAVEHHERTGSVVALQARPGAAERTFTYVEQGKTTDFCPIFVNKGVVLIGRKFGGPRVV